MGLFSGLKECGLVDELLVRNKIPFGEKIYFSNLVYTDKDGKEFEILYIFKNPYSAYDGIIVNVNDKEVRLSSESLPIITLVYLRMQKLEMEYNNQK